MNILFLTLLDFGSYREKNIYCDLLRCFVSHGHTVYCISPAERRVGKETHLAENGRLLKLKIGNTQKTNIIEKGISTLRIEPQFIAGIKRYFSDVTFDLVIYSTPPVTFAKVVSFLKKRDGARTYLLLKDIFPQNAVDLGMMRKSGIKALLYRFFRRKERALYRVSDRIGCMSQANVDFILADNPEIDPSKVEVCPNSIEVMPLSKNRGIREKYGIPLDKTTFVYGGNLGRPQDIPFLIKCLDGQKDKSDRFFLIVGSGTEFHKLRAYFDLARPKNAKLLSYMPKEDYDAMLTACDVGLIFLDHRFTIPNFPSRLLSYMQAGLPVLTCTDRNTDIGKTVIDGGFGWQSFSDDTVSFQNAADAACAADLADMGERSYRYLKAHYSTEISYRIIMR